MRTNVCQSSGIQVCVCSIRFDSIRFDSIRFDSMTRHDLYLSQIPSLQAEMGLFLGLDREHCLTMNL
ncbi:hypothetical protein EMIT0P12_10961 [Pseudomonas sp. IT-P12]